MTTMPSTLGKKLLLGAMIGFGGIAILFLSHVLRMRVIANVDEAIYGDMNAGINVIGQTFTDASSEQEQLIRFLFGIPSVAAITRAKARRGIDLNEGEVTAQWKKRLETIFISLMSQYVAIEQIRLIEANGRESVRVERFEGKSQVVEGEELQNKANRDYVQAINQLPPNSIYFSPISLNQENNVVSMPYQPMIRVGMPIFHGDGQTRYGMLVVNFDTTTMVHRMVSALRTRMSLIITSESGDFIYHPDRIREFGHDLHSKHNWTHDYQYQSILSDRYPEIRWYLDTQTNQRYLVLSKSIASGGEFSDHQVSSRPVMFHVLVSESFYLAETAERDHFSLIIIIGVVILLFVLLVLITSVFRTRYRLSAIEEQNNVIIRSSVDAIIGLDTAGYFTIWNSAAEKLFGYSMTQVLTRNVDELVLFNGIDFPLFRVQMMSEPRAKSIELEAITTAGDVIPVSVNITPIIQDGDQYIGIACMVRDISDYKNYQQELLKMAQGLEEQVIERTKELLAAHKTASDINQLKSIFISNLSHEIRTQLNNITGMLGLIQKESLTTSQRRFFRIIDNSTYTLLYLATDALELSNPEGGELALRPENFNLIALVEILISTMTFQAQQKHLELILDVSDVTWVTMRGDVNRFKHIIMNLVGNAIQYTDNGSVLVTIASKQQEDGRIRVDGQVIDSGCGMTKEKQAILFQETRHSTRSKISSLSLCKQICELMSGDLEVQSEEYKGSTFHFHIYLQPLENTQTPTIVKSLSALTFEIYSPDLQVTTSLENMLAYFGGRVLHNDLLAPMSPVADVILLDASSPERVAVYKRWESWVLSHPKHPPLLIELYPLLDGYPTKYDSDKGDAKKDGVGRTGESTSYTLIKYLHKPVVMSELLSCLNAQDPNLQWLMYARVRGEFLTLSDELLQRFSQTAVLIVDDNRINREVTATILESVGIQCLLANNGQEAIDILSESSIRVDMIFMDCHMPIIDGYTCTTLIRHGEAGERYQNIPIIAFTADAVPGERDQCLRVGMNDYLSKPVTAEDLTDKVRQYARDVVHPFQNMLPESVTMNHPEGPSVADSTTSEMSAPHGESSHELVMNKGISDDLNMSDETAMVSDRVSQWNRTGALVRMMDNESLLRQIAQMYLDGAEEKQMQLNTVIEQLERQAIRDCSHAIKGLAADVGADTVAAILNEIESIALDGEQSVLRQKYSQFEKCQEQVLHEMRLYLQN